MRPLSPRQFVQVNRTAAVRVNLTLVSERGTSDKGLLGCFGLMGLGVGLVGFVGLVKLEVRCVGRTEKVPGRTSPATERSRGAGSCCSSGHTKRPGCDGCWHRRDQPLQNLVKDLVPSCPSFPSFHRQQSGHQPLGCSRVGHRGTGEVREGKIDFSYGKARPMIITVP